MSELWTSIYPKESFLSLQHWQPPGLLGATWIKPSLFTLAESIIDRQIGDLHPEDAFRIPQALALLLNNHYLQPLPALAMPHRTLRSKAISPLFVLRAGEFCPQCGEGTNAFALLASGLYNGVEGGSLNDVILLKDIEYLPKNFLALLTERCPGWRFDQEEPFEPFSLMNHCLRSGTKLTDSYTHAEPGSASYPTSPDECWSISVFLLPVTGEVSVVCGWSVGGLTDWLDYDQAKPWEALVAV